MKTIVAVSLIALSSVAFARGNGGNHTNSSQGYNAYSPSYGKSTGTSGTTGSHGVQGYVRDSGTYVQPHMKTNPNTTRNDNYSTRGNVNPYTGTLGTKPRDGQY